MGLLRLSGALIGLLMGMGTAVALGQATDPDTGEFLPTAQPMPASVQPGANPGTNTGGNPATKPLPNRIMPSAAAAETVPAVVQHVPVKRPPLGPISSAHREGILSIGVVVSDALGRTVTGLEASDFTLLDNEQPTRIFSFRGGSASGSDPPPQLIFVLDALNLSGQQYAQAERACAEFLRARGAALEQPVSVYWLARDGLTATQSAWHDGNALAAALGRKEGRRMLWGARRWIDQPMIADGENRLQTFLSEAALGAIALDQRDTPGPKTVIWLGPGWPVITGVGGFDWVTEFSTRLREARITLDVVSAWPPQDKGFRYQDHLAPVENSKAMHPGILALPVLATHTGGLVTEDGTDLRTAIERCVAEAAAAYTLTFDPAHTETADEYHDLRVAISRPGLTARTVAGYYDEPVYFDHARPGVEKLTVAQLEEVLRQSGGADLGHRLAGVELTERLSSDRLAADLELLRRDKERQALVAAADFSAFLPLPAAEIPPDPRPDVAAQRTMLKLTFDYLAKVIPKLPDFFATRSTVFYEEPKDHDEKSWKLIPADQALHVANTAKGTVLYRNGNEIVDGEVESHKHSSTRERNLDTKGTFGPVLASVLVAAAKGQTTVSWGHWEHGPQGIMAVFKFAVPPSTPLFEVTYCCLPEGDGKKVYRNMTGYYGEFGIDPASGAILRLAIQADLDPDREPDLPIIRSGLMVEYGPVKIAGQTYLCPVRSVSVSRGRTVRVIHEWAQSLVVYGPFESMIDDVGFADYHKFGSESRVLAGFEEPPGDAETKKPQK